MSLHEIVEVLRWKGQGLRNDEVNKDTNPWPSCQMDFKKGMVFFRGAKLPSKQSHQFQTGHIIGGSWVMEATQYTLQTFISQAKSKGHLTRFCCLDFLLTSSTFGSRLVWQHPGSRKSSWCQERGQFSSLSRWFKLLLRQPFLLLVIQKSLTPSRWRIYPLLRRKLTWNF